MWIDFSGDWGIFLIFFCRFLLFAVGFPLLMGKTDGVLCKTILIFHKTGHPFMTGDGTPALPRTLEPRLFPHLLFLQQDKGFSELPKRTPKAPNEAQKRRGWQMNPAPTGTSLSQRSAKKVRIGKLDDFGMSVFLSFFSFRKGEKRPKTKYLPIWQKKRETFKSSPLAKPRNKGNITVFHKKSKKNREKLLFSTHRKPTIKHSQNDNINQFFKNFSYFCPL